MTFVTGCTSGPTQATAELDRLQGHWEGDGAGGECTISITGTSLHYRAGTSWYQTTFALASGTHPRQLHATIKDCGPSKDAIGEVVLAIYKLDQGKLYLRTYSESEGPPKSFDSRNQYIVEKVEAHRSAGLE